ncbi:MAG: outer membrane protein assembly factor BamE [Elusimicrobiaceae bacterium]|nr:outer membrane protein assembly factor BamE [Elusimicrobiaceae bacterium]
MKKTLLVLLVGCLVTMGCYASFPSEKQERMTIAKVQKEIKVGMSSAEVVEILGSPNMVTTDDLRRETWVYDKISTQIDSSGSEMGVWFLLGAGSNSRSSTRSSQKTLTIIVKFDSSNKVRDFAYRTSSF